ncbi:MAG: galactose-1-phosphate uridylyltransferase [Candidatus Thorarchaeota archaeon]
MSEIRWSTMLGEWVIVTQKNANRPLQESDIPCSICQSIEETKEKWDVIKQDDPDALLQSSDGPFELDEEIVIGAPAFGFSKIIIQSPNHNEQIEDMDDVQLTKVLAEYLSVFKELDTKKGIKYVLQFEQRTKSKGSKTYHTHAKVYALPFVPLRGRREIDQIVKYQASFDTCMICETIENEFKTKARVIRESDNFVSIVPYAARVPYEVHLYPKNHVASILELKDDLFEMGMMIQDVVKRFSNIFDENEYVMVFHTRPSKDSHDFWHFHIEFYPSLRNISGLQDLVEIETGAGILTNNSSPEENAKELRDTL